MSLPGAPSGEGVSESELLSLGLAVFWLAVLTSLPKDAGKAMGLSHLKSHLENPCLLSLGAALSLTLRDGDGRGPLHLGGLLT